MTGDNNVSIQVSVDREMARRALRIEDLDNEAVNGFFDEMLSAFEVLDNADRRLDSSEIAKLAGIDDSMINEESENMYFLEFLLKSGFLGGESESYELA